MFRRIIDTIDVILETDRFKSTVEALKEIARWALLFAVSWVITQTLAQIDLVPETRVVTVWVFSYTLPIRFLVNLGLTMLGRFIDKYLYEYGKLKDRPSLKKGLTRF